MDFWIRKTLDHAYDRDGAWAAGGTVDQTLLTRLMEEPYFLLPPPKSTGRELFSTSWLESRIAQCGQIEPRNVAATLLALTVNSIADAIENFLPTVPEVYVCGGGSHNNAVMEGLRNRLESREIKTTGALGIDSDWVEAAAFAWLAAKTLHNKPGNLPSVTGARKPVVLGRLFRI
jgi:anhydro-N-acetylmuramic acid kinase